MRKYAGVMVMFFLLIGRAQAQNTIESLDPLQSAMARSLSARHISPSVMLSNPALLGFVPKISLGIYNTRPYGLPELQLTNLSASLEYRRLTGGISFSYCGDPELITTGIFSLALDYQVLKHFNLGIRGDYRRDSFAEDYVDRDMYSFAAGLAVEYSRMVFHAAVSEINRPRLCDRDSAIEPGYQLGVSFMQLSYLILNLELSGRGDDNRFHFGQEFSFGKCFFLRLGIITNPTLPSAGMGIRYGRFNFNYAIDRHSALGETHSFGINTNL